MSKDIIKRHLLSLISEEKPVGLTKTEKIQKDDKEINDKYYKEVEKKMVGYDKSSKQEEADSIEPVMYKNDTAEEEYHNDMEIRNGMEMLKYGNDVPKIFKDRNEMYIAGDTKTGNKTHTGVWNPETGEGNGNTESVWGASNDNFGKELIDTIRRSAEKRDKAITPLIQFGNDIEVLPKDTKTIGDSRKVAVEGLKRGNLLEDVMADKNYTHFAIYKPTNQIMNAWNYKGYDPEELKMEKNTYFFEDLVDIFGNIKKSDVNIVNRKALDSKGIDPENIKNWYRPQEEASKINKPVLEGIKRLKFKNEFKGVHNALNLIPESYRVDNKTFEMTDGNESYRFRWEGTLTEGKAIVLRASNQTVINEDINKMKHLMGFKSSDTLGRLDATERINENQKFSLIWDKTKSIFK